MTDLFVYGTLCHGALRQAVLGREVCALAAVLPSHAVFWAMGKPWPLIQTVDQSADKSAGGAAGLLLCDLHATDLARLDFYEGGFGYHPRRVAVQADGKARSALAYFPAPAGAGPQAGPQAGPPWDLSVWVQRIGELSVETAVDVMALFGRVSPAAARARYALMQDRAASRMRARAPSPTARRFHARPQDVAVAGWRQPYAAFFALEECDVSWRQFAGDLGPTVTRAALVATDAVTVLPYDPRRDRVLVVEQFRVGPHVRGDTQPWQLEAIAGRIDADETPEQAARREAVEETGLELGALLPVASYYPTPGMCSEYLYSYVAIADLPEGSAGVFGLADEAEDIRAHLISFDALMALIASGEVANAPLILTALWLQRERPRLRKTL